MRYAAVLGSRGRVYGGPHEGMAEAHLRADHEQLFRLGCRCRTRWDAERLRGTPEERGVAGGIRGREQQQLLCRLRKRSDASRVVVLDVTGKNVRTRRAKAAGQLRRVHLPRQLQQPQRVPAGLCHDAVANLLIELTRYGRHEKRPCVFLGEPTDGQGRQCGQQLLVAGLPDREQEQHRARPASAGRRIPAPGTMARRATGHRRPGKLAGVPPPPRPASQGRQGPPETDPECSPPRARTRPAMPAAAVLASAGSSSSIGAQSRSIAANGISSSD